MAGSSVGGMNRLMFVFFFFFSAFMQNVALKLNEYWNEKTYGKLQNPQEQNT